MKRNILSYDRHIVGIINFGDKVDVTDPCYNKPSMTVTIKPGEYMGVVHENYEGRITCIEMLNFFDTLHKDFSYEEYGEVPVDAGLCGFFDNKPAYKGDKWLKVCDYLDSIRDNKNEQYYPAGKHTAFNCDGFCSQSGFGDGLYPVDIAKNEKGEVVAVRVTFIE